MISRLERNREALLTAQSHLDRYLTKRFEAGGNVPERHVSPQRGERPYEPQLLGIPVKLNARSGGKPNGTPE